MSGKWEVKTRRLGTIHIVRYWEVVLDGVAYDTFDNREMASALVAFRNSRRTMTPWQRRMNKLERER